MQLVYRFDFLASIKAKVYTAAENIFAVGSWKRIISNKKDDLMETEKQEILCFDSKDEAGNLVPVIAERSNVWAMNSFWRNGPWSYRTEDGRQVNPLGAFGLYEIAESKAHLKTDDPREPKS